MPDFKYKISVIIPVYNCAEYLYGCVKSLLKQTMSAKDFQIIFINDGSSDNSGEICRELAKKYKCIVYFEKENGGVSSARNKGLELAEGKYILFLDADDTLSKDTLKKIYSFFEKHYDETDLVTYKIIPYWKEKRFGTHYRYRIMNKTGIYDLNDETNCYIAQTTMNVCVKNMRNDNVLFDTTLKYHEDQKYCYDIIKRKMTIGFCSGPEYLYLRRPGSTTGEKSYAYYIYEDTTAMWEKMFAEYSDSVPAYLQSLFLNDVKWKGVSDVLLPYHYSEPEFDRAVDRLVALIKRIDDSVIINRPAMDIYHKHFLLTLKGSNAVELVCSDDRISLCFNDEEIYGTEKITAVVNRFSVRDGKIRVDAFLKSPIFMYCSEPELYLIKDGVRERLELTHSEHEHYHSKIKTAVFWRFQFEIEAEKTERFELETVINGCTYKITYYYGNSVPLQRGKKLKLFFRDGKCYREKNGVFNVYSDRRRNGFLYKLLIFIYNVLFYFPINPGIVFYRLGAHIAQSKKERVWIYLDRYGVFDNAYDQFKHDIKINDGVKRYYILNECDWDSLEEKFEPAERKSVVKFQSKRHKRLYFTCEKLITSFSNLSNVSPFGAGPMRWYADLAKYELIYLQHGILHASLKNMYAKERCIVDRVVVSSNFEIKNFTENYGYSERDLIKSCMPRYDFMKSDGVKKNRIVFSPSWRSNLIGPLVNNSREEKSEAFLNSDFYREVSAFLNSERLNRLLEENDLYLDFKNHPIFKCYNNLFEISNSRVCIDGFDTETDEYRLMITDYSSIVFDAVYMNCPIIYFVPDYDKFLAGVSHGYRKLDLPMENGFGPFTQTADGLIDELEKTIKNGFLPQEPYNGRMKDFFLYKDNNCRDRFYKAVF